MSQNTFDITLDNCPVVCIDGDNTFSTWLDGAPVVENGTNILLVPKFHTHRQRTLELTPDSNLTIL